MLVGMQNNGLFLWLLMKSSVYPQLISHAGVNGIDE